MNVTEYAVHRLTEPHTIQVEGHTTEWVPLLLWIKERVTANDGRGNGSGGIGIPLNDDALEVLQNIETKYRELCATVRLAANNDLVAGVRQLWETIVTEQAGGRLTDQQWESMCDEFPAWVAQIEGEQEKPRKMELTVPCPRCENRWLIDDLGRRVSAVVVEFAPGRAPVAECRVTECAALWAGWAQVARLGFTIGAEQDVHVLAACGIDTPKLEILTLM